METIRCFKTKILKPSDGHTWKEMAAILRNSSKQTAAIARYTQSVLVRSDTAFLTATDDNKELSFPKTEKGKLKLDPLENENRIYKTVAGQFSNVPARVVNYIVRSVSKNYKNERKLIVTGNQSIRDYKSFPLMTDYYHLRQIDGNYILEISIFKDLKLSFVIATKKLPAEYLKVLNDIVSIKTSSKNNLVKIFSKTKNNRTDWFVLFTYKKTFSDNRDFVKGRTMFVYPPGQGRFLRCEVNHKAIPAEKNDIWFEDLEYDSAIQSLKSLNRIRNNISAKYRQDSMSASKGHGLKRALKNKTSKQHKRTNSIKTFNYNRVAYIIKLARRWKVEYIEYADPSAMPDDGYRFVDSWPWFELKELIKRKCLENSIVFKEANIENITERQKEISI